MGILMVYRNFPPNLTGYRKAAPIFSKEPVIGPNSRRWNYTSLVHIADMKLEL
jgi:hypothetical protein